MKNADSILVTGGTGSFGRAFVRMVLKRFPQIRRVIVYSRDEFKQFEMATAAEYADPRMRFFIGDVRDKERLQRAMEDVDIVVHAAALKQVPLLEYNPFEAVKTNVLGAQNVIECCLDQGVRQVVALSTDKAAAPINLYGATKLCSDKLFVAANQFKGAHEIRFSVVRYGNVMGSRGSVIPFFLKKRRDGVLPITHEQMTRFNITLDQAVDFVLMAMDMMMGGEIFVPRIPSYRITDLAKAIAPGCRSEIVGIRPGEKLHEDLITPTDALQAAEFKHCYVILPGSPRWDVKSYLAKHGGRMVPPGFSYSSGTNTEWLSVEMLRELIRTHLDSSFEPYENGQQKAPSLRAS